MPQVDVLPPAPKVTLRITPEILDISCRQDSSHCMIADAVREAAPWARNVTVDIQTIRFSDPERGVRYTYLTPRVAQLALVDFDAGQAPEPFSCVLTNRVAHVSFMRKRPTGAIRSEAQTEAVRANIAKARQYSPKVRQYGNTTAHVPNRVGGKSAPLGALASGTTGRKRDGDIPTARRREFGIRGLGANKSA